VRNWIDAGSLPAVRVGRRVRIKRSDLERVIAEGYNSGSDTANGTDGSVFWSPESDASQQPLSASFGNEELWTRFGAAAARLGEAISGANPDEIGGAFHALADASEALGDEMVRNEPTD